MPVRPRPSTRFRVLLWLDAAQNVEQVAVATYLDDDKQTELTWAPEPFDSPGDALAAAVRTLDAQLALW